MGKIGILVALIVILSSCNKKFTIYTAEIDQKLGENRSKVQFYISEDIELELTARQDTLTVDNKGVIEERENSERKNIFVAKGTKMILKNSEDGVLWMEVDPKERRLIPFIPERMTPMSSFKIRGEGFFVTLTDEQKYTLFGIPPILQVTKKSIKNLTEQSIKAKGSSVSGK